MGEFSDGIVGGPAEHIIVPWLNCILSNFGKQCQNYVWELIEDLTNYSLEKSTISLSFLKKFRSGVINEKIPSYRYRSHND